MKRISLITLIAAISFVIKGQDLHFSQFFTNQAGMNPALTGAYNADMGVAIIHRTQWRGIDANFENTSHTCDLKFNLGSGMLGIGTMATLDKLPSAKYTANSLALSLAYHYYLDYTKRHLISFGTQVGYSTKSFNPGGDLEFGNQFMNYEFNPNVANGENLVSGSLTSLNVNAGINYLHKLSARTTFKVGVSTFSLTTPNESFISAKNDNQLGVRYLSYFMVDYALNPKIILSPKILYTNQSRGEDISAGILGTYKLKSCMYVQAGLFHRVKDSGVLMLGYGFRSYLLRASMDITTSTLKGVGSIEDAGYKPPRAFEIGFIYTGVFRKHLKTNLTVPCGIF